MPVLAARLPAHFVLLYPFIMRVGKGNRQKEFIASLKGLKMNSQ